MPDTVIPGDTALSCFTVTTGYGDDRAELELFGPMERVGKGFGCWDCRDIGRDTSGPSLFTLSVGDKGELRDADGEASGLKDVEGDGVNDMEGEGMQAAEGE